LGLVVVAIIVITVQQVTGHDYNNYLTFSTSLKVLLSHESLYIPHPEYHQDLYKYSPTFALFMAPFTWQPVATGLFCWNLLNGLSLVAALRLLITDDRRAVIAIALVAIELATSLQNAQSNALVAALVIFAFVDLERQRNWRAGLSIAGGFFLKGYGLAAGVLALVYPQRLRAIGTTVVWFVALALSPLVILSIGELSQQYVDWFGVRGTFEVTRNASVMRVWARYVDSGTNPLVLQAIGGIVFLLPFGRVHAWPDPRFRLGLLCSLLVALVIFNNSAEPPTFIIAVAGGAIWYATGQPRSRLDRALVLALILGVSLISTDVYPRAWRGAFMGPYTGKAMGCLILWLRINWELLKGNYGMTTHRGTEALS
jgi:hypothetical protein